MKYRSDAVLQAVLSAATDEERLALTRVLDEAATVPWAPQLLQIRICAAGGHEVANWLRGGGVSYLEMLSDATKNLGIRGLRSIDGQLHGRLTVRDLDDIEVTRKKGIANQIAITKLTEYVEKAEAALIAELVVKLYDAMKPDSRRRFDLKLAEFTQKNGWDGNIAITSAGAAIVLGNLGGFATYTLMSSALSAISLGTLSFGAYTAASSALSVVLGPIGWAVLGLGALLKFFAPDDQKVLRLVATLAMIRQRASEAGVDCWVRSLPRIAPHC